MNSTRFNRISNLTYQFIQRFGSLILVLIIWEALVRLNILDYRFFPAPSTVLITLFHLIISGEIPIHAISSLQRVLLGFLVGSSLGLVVGLAMGWSRSAEQIIDPLISIFYPIPKIALLPLMMIIFGIGDASKVAITTIATFFTVVINTAAGVRTIEPVFLDAARSFGAKGLRMFIKVVIPATLPAIFTGLRLAAGIALIVIIASEFVSSRQGLGYFIWLSWGTLSTREMYAGLIVIGLIGLVSTKVLNWSASLLMPWYADEEQVRPRKKTRTISQNIYFDIKIKRIPEAIFTHSRQYLYQLPNHVSLTEPKISQENIRYEWIDESNVDAIRPWPRKGWRLTNQFRRNLNRGMIGIFAFSQDQVVGYMWAAVKTSLFSISSMHYPIEVGDAFIKGTEVHPEFRRHGVASYLRYKMMTRIRELGSTLEIKRICGTVLLHNTPMMKFLDRQGSVRVQELIQFRLTPYIFVRWIWDLNQHGKRKRESGRLKVNFKTPKFLSDPFFHKYFGIKILKTDRIWQPKGEA